MGIHIDAHAIDVAALQRVLERPLWSILLDLSDPNSTSLGEDILFNAFDQGAVERYHVMPDRRVVLVLRGGERRLVPRESLAEVPFLRQTTRQYLSDPEGSPLCLLFLLRDLPATDGYRYAWEITSGHRRWWIGSALHAAELADRLNSAEFQELAGYFARILSGHDCGYTLESQAPRPYSREFPVVFDPDSRLAVFDEPECRRLIRLLDRLMDSRPRFDCPPELLRPGEDPDWTDYVADVVNQFRSIRSLPLPNLRLVTFIG